ncbi:uncharacterized protein SPSK_03661 [Sporothrix schenckii 1099-18]|uniref:CoA-binding domain-containing protein n=2 Tax=Sporothrix schenckii TaxID=29908 RepID=U7PSV6_SPOS1|nr:uncharacterized protein SPSK_03661 [Sporothrix schenckii 1099-18]ERS97540.1 hypothetical protein HMPREF1624_05709 [Sporothrix schenckii ATCC 58251]KJR82052.1 hypothetical protein SPSK_03661 [Sporothrix schenckii 1099-18]
MPLPISATEANARAFFAKPYFAVVGASTNQAKFGYKIFAWYARHDLPATPINPTAPSISVDRIAHATLPNISALPHPHETGLSVITPPPVTLQVLQDAQKLGIGAVWLQPGTWDDDVVKYATTKGHFTDVVAGEGGRGDEGWCVLVDGERALKANGKL